MDNQQINNKPEINKEERKSYTKGVVSDTKTEQQQFQGRVNSNQFMAEN